MKQAQCPQCGLWSDVEWQSELPPGGYWWINSGVCPKCNAPICVESECRFREIDLDCAECEKPDQWEALYQEIARLRAELRSANREISDLCWRLSNR